MPLPNLRKKIVLPDMGLGLQNQHPTGFAGGETRMTVQINGTIEIQ